MCDNPVPQPAHVDAARYRFNAIIDVRRHRLHRHEMISLNISQNTSGLIIVVVITLFNPAYKIER